jgi:seryl-tRNA synthetase
VLDARVVRASPDAVKEATRVKGIASPELVDAWLVADETRRRAQTGAEALRAEQRKWRASTASRARAMIRAHLRRYGALDRRAT